MQKRYKAGRKYQITEESYVTRVFPAGSVIILDRDCVPGDIAQMTEVETGTKGFRVLSDDLVEVMSEERRKELSNAYEF